MDELEQRRTRRLRPRRAPRATGAETAESVLPEVPRVGALDALLREVDSLRLSLETDLTLAAAAVAHGAYDVAAGIIDGDREGLGSFERHALEHVAELARRRRRLRVPAAPFVAAAAVVAFLVGVVPSTTGGTAGDATLTAEASFLTLSDAAARGETDKVVTAASRLHSQLASAVARAGTDPVAASRALGLLAAERSVIERSGDRSHQLTGVLAASTNLTNAITAALPRVPHPAVTPPVTVVLPRITAAPHVERPTPSVPALPSLLP